MFTVRGRPAAEERMMKPQLLRLHRWITLAFAIPLAIVIVTGLILSFEPITADRLLTGRSISLASVEAAIAKHDPERKATSLNVRAFENMVVLQAGRGSAPVRIELASGEKVDPARSTWSDTLTTARRLHESLLINASWLVSTATIAMMISMLLGLFMGLPRLRNTLGGWHRVTAWSLAPLLLLSPLTGLALAYGITLTGPPQKIEGAPVSLAEAIKIVAAKHDLASVVWIRPQGGATRARIYDGREANVFAVTKDGLVGGARNWPRAIHEGVWAGVYSGLINVIISIALIGLMITGLWIWARRTFRRRRVSAPVAEGVLG
jgi:uncharacterized iron-regulated membrane protein